MPTESETRTGDSRVPTQLIMSLPARQDSVRDQMIMTSKIESRRVRAVFAESIKFDGEAL